MLPTRNVERTLARCLTSIKNQTWRDVELIVVDNHSTDSTASIAQRTADRFELAGPERSAQRNLGFAAARGQWVMWIDADMILAPGVIENCLDVAQRAHAEAVSIPEISIGPGYWTKCRALERSCYLDDPGLFNPRLLRAGVLERVGGFAEEMSGPEDLDLRIALSRAGITTAMATEFIAHDEGHLTLGSIIAKRVYYGRALPKLAEKRPGATTAQGSATVAALWRHRTDLARRPLVGPGVIAMRAIEVGAYAYGAYLGGKS